MKLLLDTHAVYWYVDQHSFLSTAARDAITESENDLFISAATIWEIAIKAGLGKLHLTSPYRTWMQTAIDELDAIILPITVEYADLQTSLPQFHRDPFDRLMAAQSLTDNIPVISNDSIFDQYGVVRVW